MLLQAIFNITIVILYYERNTRNEFLQGLNKKIMNALDNRIAGGNV